MTNLRRRMIQDMELRRLKPNTQQAYLDAVKDLAQHYGRSPDRLSEEELRHYFVHLSQSRRWAMSTLRVRLFGIKFLFRHTLRRPLPVFDLVRLPRVRLHYRRANQSQQYRIEEMQFRGGCFEAEIPAEYTNSPYPLVYYFELHGSEGGVWLWPGLAEDLSNQPYFVVRCPARD